MKFLANWSEFESPYGHRDDVLSFPGHEGKRALVKPKEARLEGVFTVVELEFVVEWMKSKR